MSELSFQDRLKAAKAAANEGGGGGDYDTIPYDKYKFVLISAECKKSKSQKDTSYFTWEVIGGEMDGKTHMQFIGLEHNVALKIFSKQMEVFGFDTDEITSLESASEMVSKAADKRPVCAVSFYKNRSSFDTVKIEDFLGFEVEDDPTAGPGTSGTTVSQTPVGEAIPEATETPEIEKGKKYRYKKNGKELTAVLKSIDYDNQTLDFGIHKSVSLDDVIALA